jgi:hypothetical protein
VQHPDHRAMNQQRHAHQGLDSLVQQNRVQHVAVIDVVQDDRPPPGGDPASETLADRDPHALPDLLFQTAGRGGDKLTPRAVQQQHRHHVGVQDLLDARQQLGEKVIRAQIRQRRIGHRPDIPEIAPRPASGPAGDTITKDYATMIELPSDKNRLLRLTGPPAR